MAVSRISNRGTFQNLFTETSTALTVTNNCTRWNLVTLRMALTNNNGTGTTITTINIVDPRGNTWEKFQVVNGQGALHDGTEALLAYSLQENPLQVGDVITLQYFTTSGMTTPLAVSGKAAVLEEWRDASRGFGGSQIHATSLLARGDNTTVVDSDLIGTTPVGYAIITALAIEGPLSDAFTSDTDTDGGVWQHLLAAGTATDANNQTIEGDWKITTAAVSQRYQATLGTARDWALRLITIRPVDLPQGSFAAPLPAITASVAVEADVEVSFAAALPGPITGAFEGEAAFLDGVLVAVLPALTADLTGQQPGAIGSTLDAALPPLTASLEGQRPGASFLEATLPAIEALIEMERTGTDGLVDVRPRRRVLNPKAFPVRWPPPPAWR